MTICSWHRSLVNYGKSKEGSGDIAGDAVASRDAAQRWAVTQKDTVAPQELCQHGASPGARALPAVEVGAAAAQVFCL